MPGRVGKSGSGKGDRPRIEVKQTEKCNEESSNERKPKPREAFQSLEVKYPTGLKRTVKEIFLLSRHGQHGTGDGL